MCSWWKNQEHICSYSSEHTSWTAPGHPLSPESRSWASASVPRHHVWMPGLLWKLGRYSFRCVCPDYLAQTSATSLLQLQVWEEQPFVSFCHSYSLARSRKCYFSWSLLAAELSLPGVLGEKRWRSAGFFVWEGETWGAVGQDSGAARVIWAQTKGYRHGRDWQSESNHGQQQVANAGEYWGWMDNWIIKQREASEGCRDRKREVLVIGSNNLKPYWVTSVGRHFPVRGKLYVQPNVMVIVKKRNVFALSLVALYLHECWDFFEENITSPEWQIDYSI